jgi:hypothetical protein
LIVVVLKEFAPRSTAVPEPDAKNGFPTADIAGKCKHRPGRPWWHCAGGEDDRRSDRVIAAQDGMLAAATPLFSVIASAAVPLIVNELALSKRIPPTVFAPFTATAVGVAGIGPELGNRPALLGVPAVQFPAVGPQPIGCRAIPFRDGRVCDSQRDARIRTIVRKVVEFADLRVCDAEVGKRSGEGSRVVEEDVRAVSTKRSHSARVVQVKGATVQCEPARRGYVDQVAYCAEFEVEAVTR